MISLEFFGILILSLILYWAIPWQRVRNWILILASFAFIYQNDKWSVVVVLGLTGFSYLIGLLIAKKQHKGLIHLTGLLGMLTLLVFFKYLGFLTGILNSLTAFIGDLPAFDIAGIILPLGISYIVFKHISYITDIKWGLVSPGRFDEFLLYSSLFTIFVAGPIERFERFKPQVEQKRIPFVWSDAEFGIRRIVFGMFRKLVIADWIGHYINPVWQNMDQYTAWIKILALFGYSIQIYMDFAGYSDIAIGSSRLFGIRIMENFRNPYLAPNISQFWRRWHISLSDWIRDYLFFPLSRLGKGKFWLKFSVPVIAMALCGLWHGAAWHFILWGVWHGMGLALYQLWCDHKRRHKELNKLVKTGVFNLPAILLTFVYITLGWTVFASAQFARYFRGLVSSFSSEHLAFFSKKGFLYIFLGGLIIFVFVPIYNRLITRVSPGIRTLIDIGLFIAIAELLLNISAGQSSFIYAGF